MKRFHLLLAVLCTLPVALQSQTADHVVISEFATQGPASGQDEFVELYNPTLSDRVIGNWTLQYKTAAGTAWTEKALLPAGAVIPAHGYYLIANTGYAGAVEPDYTSSLWTLASGVSAVGHFRILDDTGGQVDKVGYGSSAVDPEGAPAPVQPSNTGSVERKARSTSTADSLAPGGLHSLLGNAYDTDDNATDFVAQTHGRNPQNTESAPEPPFGTAGSGTGRVGVTPGTVYSGRIVALRFSVLGDSMYTLTTIQCIVPQEWSWSGAPGDVILSGPGFATAQKSVSGDTVTIRSAAVSASDTGIITLQGMGAPGLGGKSVFRYFTGVVEGDLARILIQPSVLVRAPVPIVTIHVNDAQGIPASPYGVGSQVTLTGNVTADFSSGTQTNVFLQDATGGVCLFSYTRPVAYSLGDSVILTGTIKQFRGIVEVTPDSSTVVFVSSGNNQPEPLVLTCSEVNETFQPDYTEPNEGRLIRINGVSYNSSNSTITDGTGTANIFVPFTPSATLFDAIGILKQYKPGSSPPPPYTADYEISPRFPSDIIAHPGPIITISPSEDSIHPASVRIRWGTDVPSTSMVMFGATLYTDTVSDAAPVTDHALWLNGLSPARIYHYAVGSADSSGTTVVSDYIFGTASPEACTGRINVYFNGGINPSVALGETARANQDLTALLVSRIGAARYSVDASFYNLSGSPGAGIASALTAAHDRGVHVRVICEADNRSNAPFETMASNGIPVITDEFDVMNAGVGLMHDKFAVIDYRGGAPESVWVWTGSWNPTDPGTNADRQDVIEIQDVALAGTYTAEFQEMWGSSVDIPNSAQSRFGSRKVDNTPHRFNIKGIPVECYFSPSDHTTAHLARTLGTARLSVCVAMDTFTRKDLADSLVNLRKRGEKVRVVLDNNTDTGNQYAYLLANNVDIHLKGFTGGLLHHKYAIMDATQSGEDQWLITGSHNWSSSAETRNDENTLILKNRRVANLYLQEFAVRYSVAGGMDPITLDVKEVGDGVPLTYALTQNYPNPFNPTTSFRFQLPRAEFVTVKVYDMLGREVATLLNGLKQAGVFEVHWDAGELSSGVYLCSLRAGSFFDVKKMLLIR